MADAVKSPEKTAEVNSSPAKGSVAEASTSDTDSVQVESKPQPEEVKHQSSRLRRFVPVLLVLFLAAVLLVVITSNWNAWVGSKGSQKTDDAYLRADITPLSTRLSGTVKEVAVEDYQRVKAGDLLVQLKDDDYRAQVAQSEAAVQAAHAALENNAKQKGLQESRIAQAQAGVEAAQADERQTYFSWSGTLTHLAAVEKARDGKRPQLQLQLWGELSYLLPAPPEYTYHQLRTEPHSIYGATIISYPKEIWVDRLRRIGVLENVLVEIPLPPSPSPEWQEVWQSLVEARDAFEQGGSTGWKGCVTAVRVALERWRGIESEQLGPGGSNPGKASDRTKRQRLDNLRWHLHHCSHYWIHNLEAECSRDDALLMISTLSSLLAERKP